MDSMTTVTTKKRTTAAIVTADELIAFLADVPGRADVRISTHEIASGHFTATITARWTHRDASTSGGAS